jgi:hypothetical protein
MPEVPLLILSLPTDWIILDVLAFSIAWFNPKFQMKVFYGQ